MAELDVLQVCIDTVKADIVEIKADIKELDKKVALTYLTLVQYEAEIKPMRAVVYGLVGLILTIVITAGVYLLINRGGTP